MVCAICEHKEKGIDRVSHRFAEGIYSICGYRKVNDDIPTSSEFNISTDIDYNQGEWVILYE